MWQVIGQTRAVSLLQYSLQKDWVAHAYLFVGPAHIGKMTLAINLAQALNCETAEPPCGQCASCQKIASTRHPDVQVISLSTNEDSVETKPQVEISIDQIRQMQHSASLPPFAGKYKVFIIDRAEFLSIEAANCLLKTLEEPVGKVVFILLATNEHLLPATVVSRCQRVELMPLAVTEIETALNKNWRIESQKAELLAKLSRGCLGWAVSAALEEGLLQQRAEWLNEVLNIINADYEERFTYVSQLVSQFRRNRELIQDRLEWWLSWWRDLLLIKVGCSGDITNVDRSVTLVNTAKDYSLAQIKTFIDNIRAAEGQLKQNANPGLVLEVLMLSLPEIKKRGETNLAAQLEVTRG